jgi:TetR/AcrR family transcriptional repressor of nem operon
MTAIRRRAVPDTRSRILDIAERLVQTRGYNGFSYADVASELKVTSASLHYHFAGKAQLGRALIERYTDRFMESLAAIESGTLGAVERLEAYIELYARVLRKGRLCLCGMLAADFQTLPRQMRQAVLDFFNKNEGWLSRILEAGRVEGSLRFEGQAEDVARGIISSLEGAMLLSRPFGDTSRFESASANLLTGLAAKADGSRP